MQQSEPIRQLKEDKRSQHEHGAESCSAPAPISASGYTCASRRLTSPLQLLARHVSGNRQDHRICGDLSPSWLKSQQFGSCFTGEINGRIISWFAGHS